MEELTGRALQLATELASETRAPLGRIIDATRSGRPTYKEQALRSLGAAAPHFGPSDSRRALSLLTRGDPDEQLRALQGLVRHLDVETPPEALRVIADGLLRYQLRLTAAAAQTAHN